MSTRTQSTEPWRTARIFAVSLAAYFVVHVCGSSLSDVPTAAEFASIDSKGQVELGDLEQFEWYLSTSQLEAFDSVAVLARNRELLELEGSARTQITTYSKSTQNSNPEVVARLVARGASDSCDDASDGDASDGGSNDGDANDGGKSASGDPGATP